MAAGLWPEDRWLCALYDEWHMLGRPITSYGYAQAQLQVLGPTRAIGGRVNHSLLLPRNLNRSRRCFLLGLPSVLTPRAPALRSAAAFSRLAMLASVSAYNVCASGAPRRTIDSAWTTTVRSSKPVRITNSSPMRGSLPGLQRSPRQCTLPL